MVPQTRVHYNCTTGASNQYGLQVYGSSSTIQLVSPLTKEQVSLDNGGGGNWGAEESGDLDQIKTITGGVHVPSECATFNVCFDNKKSKHFVHSVHSTFGTLAIEVAKWMDTAVTEIRFFFDGESINLKSTPCDEDIDPGDEVQLDV